MNRSHFICRFFLSGFVAFVLLSMLVLGCRKKASTNADAWRIRLQQPKLSAAEFSQVIADGIAEKVSGANVRVEEALTVIVDLEIGETTCDLTNVWNDCRGNVEGRTECVNRYLETLASTLARLSKLGPLNLDDVVPLVKDKKWLAESDAQGMNLHREAIAADLFVVYAEDGPDHLRFVDRQDFVELELPADEIREMAVANLRSRLPKIERYGEGPVYMLAAGGTFESSLLLLPEVWRNVDEAVDGRAIVAVPSRDLLMFTGENAREAVAEMREMAAKIHLDGKYLISKELLLLNDGDWERLPSPNDVPKLRLESQPSTP